ncbi:glycosyltransferase [Nocardioides sp. BP30]|uniref:glycosyltransferase n=1 Tax=Nocardioides sp. BP30 TaxID=3036374 RepID=UPI002468446A|nr:glycosyltransferase [Nocardioides sp. BP30]WGL50997.1 glycosyltransferase [Nocardioides sp. BP30]
MSTRRTDVTTMRILHVSEALGGGITSAISAMVEATPELDHHLLARPRTAHDTGTDLARLFTSVTMLPRNPVAAVGSVRRRVRELFPDIVHAHSSVAGAVVRIAGLRGARVVYSPHCFAFERRDLSALQRRAFTGIERGLAARTDLLLAVAPSELDLAVGLGHDTVAYAPNRPVDPALRRAGFSRPLHIVAAGRICRQKDWHYLLHVKRYAENQLGLRARWTWLGGGEPADERQLAAAGVEVTGWLGQDEILDRLADAQVYLHTAAWEAAPLSILEAASAGLPLAVRSIPPLDSLDLPGLAGSAVALAHRLADLEAPHHWYAAQRASLTLAARHSREHQRRSLLDAYGRVLGRADEAELPTELPTEWTARAVLPQRRVVLGLPS